MLSRIISTHSRHFRHLSIPLFQPSSSSSSSSSTTPLPQIPNFNPTLFITRHFSSSNNNNNNNGENPTSDFWKIASEKADLDDIFGTHDVNLTDNSRKLDKDSNFATKDSWVVAENENNDRVFEERESGGGGGVGVSDEWGPTTKEYEPWILEGDEKLEDLFGIDSFVGETKTGGEVVDEESDMVKAAKNLELDKEEQLLKDVLKGPNRAFGDLIAASGITDAMLDSLIALKNFEDIDGLPPLTQIEDERFQKTLQKSSRYELELQKQEEAAKSRVREVDEKGRAYGTGKRKCSIARVWIQPGEGKFAINDKEFDVYFPMLDHRAALLRPFAETKTLGLWDVKCTVKGGGTTGQVDAIRLGISRALQCWEPGLRPPLREAGFLTRDSRIVERKKPGKAKARKSFQWVKR